MNTLLFLPLALIASAAEPPRVTPAHLPDWFPASLFKVATPGNGFEAYDYEEGSFVVALRYRRDKSARG